MVSTEERLKILQMIQEGKITADQGMALLKAMGGGKGAEGVAEGTGAPRWMRIRVTDTGSGKVRVNIRMPVSVVNAGIKMGARFSPEVQGMDMDKLSEFIRSGEIGQVVDVVDEKDGEHVEVFLE